LRIRSTGGLMNNWAFLLSITSEISTRLHKRSRGQRRKKGLYWAPMLEYNEIKPKTFIVLDGEPYEVIDSHVFRKQQRKPVNQTKLKNLITGKVAERSFHQSEKADEADLQKRQLVFIYQNRGEWWFHEVGNPGARFSIPEATIGDERKFLKENTEVEGLFFNDVIIGVRLPIKMTLKVVEAPPNVKGNTAQGGNKPVTLETGAIVTTPMFVEVGDMIEVNTQTGEYTGRTQ